MSEHEHERGPRHLEPHTSAIEDAPYGLLELEEWETDIQNCVADHGILPDALSIDHDIIEVQTREIYDLVEHEGVDYASNQ